LLSLQSSPYLPVFVAPGGTYVAQLDHCSIDRSIVIMAVYLSSLLVQHGVSVKAV
jgi:hypothetical protein